MASRAGRPYPRRMATRPSTIEHLLDRMAGAGAVSARKMFGEYALYLNGRVVALVCDDTLFLKPTAGGRALLGAGAAEAPPYRGAKPHLLVPDEVLEEEDRLAALLRATVAEVPLPAPKRPRKE